LVARSYFYLLYDYTRQCNELRVDKLRQLVVDTINGYKPLPTNWVYMNDEQKNEWLEEQGADSTVPVDLFIKEVA
jgi:hypothetical protein